MSAPPDEELPADVARLLSAYAATHASRDADGLAALYASDAAIADLAPPISRHGVDVTALRTWFESWSGPVAVEFRDARHWRHGDISVVFALKHTRTRDDAGETSSWWSRVTFALTRTDTGWSIQHEHDSVPFHMDESLRAGLDLAPNM